MSVVDSTRKKMILCTDSISKQPELNKVKFSCKTDEHRQARMSAIITAADGTICIQCCSVLDCLDADFCLQYSIHVI
jgi:hypothetical protein